MLTALTVNFQNIYEEYQPRIRQYLCRLVGPDEAEDLAQEVFVKVGQALSEFRGDSSVSTWIYKIATNSALDRLSNLSARRRAEIPLEGEPRGGLPDAEHALFGKEMRACLDQHIARLPAPYRAVFVLSEEQGLTNPEIADALGISLATVKIRLHRARRRLQHDLERRCHFSRDARDEMVCEPKSPAVSIRR